MFSSTEFIKQSLGLHLFFARIMKEHSFFLQVGFTPRDDTYIQQADIFRKEFDELLEEAVSLSNGVVSPEILQSGEVITQFTLNAEMATTYFTGVEIPTGLTQAEAELTGGGLVSNSRMLEQKVFRLNQRAIYSISELIRFKKNILSNVTSCNMFTYNYPLLIIHIIRESELYLETLNKLQNGVEVTLEKEAYKQEFFWNRQMAEHAKFIRGLLDPTENDLIRLANNFGDEFDQLTEKAKAAMDRTVPFTKVTDESLKATQDLRDFKAQGTQ